MSFTENAPVRVVVVDACPLDYVRLAQSTRRAGLRFYSLSSGQDALRAAPTLAVDLWIINLELPDMSGLELVERLQPRARGSDVFFVANRYQAEDERRALALGVTMYLCKPVRLDWLRQWRRRRDGAARAEDRPQRAAHVNEPPPRDAPVP